ncbi:MAG: hypothetical protein J0H06_02390 [Actinobacteria bacterium]|nr:hypothetical protein [Actinomycetota bacterium]OJU86144.1 MAG: hypothetical protein BGO11_01060 [Solirubrobacterales bacterium 70-9]
MRSLGPAGASAAAVAAALLILFPPGFPNYDTMYFLVWGREVGEGVGPDYGSVLPPTPHPLATVVAALLSPLGHGAVVGTMVIAYASLGLVAFLVYRLGARWFDPAVGVLAAVIVLTRAPFLSNGLRAYVDLPYIALCLGALALVGRNPRGGRPALALLALAGLLRPEAWLFSVAYLAYLLATFERRGRRWTIRWRRGCWRAEVVGLVALGLAAPSCWALFDLVTTGSLTYSFTGTRETVEALDRQTGPVDLILYGPRRLGEVLQWPGMVGAAAGLAFGLGLLRRRSTPGAVGVGLALGAFGLLGTAGLAIIPRYTMLAAALLAIFAALALLGWRLLPRGDRWRRRWQLAAVALAVLFAVWIPTQYELDSRVATDLANQGRIEGDLHRLIDSGAFAVACGPISVPNHRAVPRLALDLGVRPSTVTSASEQGGEVRGYFLAPASPFVIHNFILDPADPSRFRSEVPAGFRQIVANRSWRLYRDCG